MSPIIYEFRTPASAQTIYDAVATDAGIKGWWAKVSNVAETIGEITELRFDKGGRIAVMKFHVDALDPGKRVSWTCVENANPVWPDTTLTWTIRDAGEHREVHFAHEGFRQGGPAYDMTVDGWRHFNASLEAYVNGLPATPSD